MSVSVTVSEAFTHMYTHVRFSVSKVNIWWKCDDSNYIFWSIESDFIKKIDLIIINTMIIDIKKYKINIIVVEGFWSNVFPMKIIFSCFLLVLYYSDDSIIFIFM